LNACTATIAAARRLDGQRVHRSGDQDFAAFKRGAEFVVESSYRFLDAPHPLSAQVIWLGIPIKIVHALGVQCWQN
jgi:hypothetical protein